MIVGIGTDIVSVRRIARFRQRHRARGLERVFTAGEVRYCTSLARSAPSLAARFAAKEAFFKALGTGYGRGGRWVEVEVVRTTEGAPRLHLHGRAREQARRRDVRHVHLTLSHTAEWATAFVVLEA